MEVKEVNISNVKTGERFRVDLGDLDDLVASIAALGVLQPITIDDSFTLLAGGRRLEAAHRAGLARIPAIIRGSGGELDLREVELAENIHRKNLDWQERARLEQRLFDLRSKKDPDLSLRKHSEDREESVGGMSRRLTLARALDAIPELEDCKNENEAWKKYNKIKEDLVVSEMSRRSEGIKKVQEDAGRHYIIREAREGMGRVKAESFDFAEVDPPYAIDLHKRKSRGAGEHGEMRLVGYNEVSDEDYPSLIEDIGRETHRVLKEDSFAVWWFGMRWYQKTRFILERVGFHVPDTPMIWVKGQVGQTASPDTLLGSCYEPFFLLRKGTGAKIRKAGRANVFSFAPIAPQKKIHPTEKPLDLMVEILETFMFPGQKMIVPFLGSGVSLRAAYALGHTAFGFDLDEMCKQRFLNQVARDRKEDDGNRTSHGANSS